MCCCHNKGNKSYTFQLWDALIGEWEVWHSLKLFANVGVARVPAKVLTRVDQWVAERVAEPFIRRGHKADPPVVEEESAEPAEGTPKGKTAVKEEGKPAKPSTKPTPHGKPANPTPPVSAPPCGTRPHSISRGGNSAGHF